MNLFDYPNHPLAATISSETTVKSWDWLEGHKNSVLASLADKALPPIGANADALNERQRLALAR